MAPRAPGAAALDDVGDRVECAVLSYFPACARTGTFGPSCSASAVSCSAVSIRPWFGVRRRGVCAVQTRPAPSADARLVTGAALSAATALGARRKARRCRPGSRETRCPPAAAVSAPAASMAMTISPRTPVDSGGRSRELLGIMRTHAGQRDGPVAGLARTVRRYLQGGLNKAFDFAAAIAEMQRFGVAPAAPLAGLTIVVEIGASLLILTGIQRWAGALVLGGFTLFATFVANRFWKMAPPESMKPKCFLRAHRADRGFVLVAWQDLKHRAAARA